MSTVRLLLAGSIVVSVGCGGGLGTHQVARGPELPSNEPAHVEIIVDWMEQHQTMDGFGACDRWNSALTDAQADLFFSATKGIGLSLLRVSMNYNGNDTSAVSNAQKAAARGALVWMAPWTAPAGWKDNGSVENGGHLLVARYDAWAARLIQFATALQSKGVSLYAISIQNEPDYAAGYQSMVYDDAEMVSFIKALGPKLAALNPRPKLIVGEYSSWGNLWSLATALEADAVAFPYLDIYAVHQYRGVPAYQSRPRPLWETEMSSFDGPSADIENGVAVARWIHEAIVNGNVNAWHYWWLVGQNDDNEGLLNPSGGRTKRLYTLGNFSRFIRPGWVRIEATAPASKVYVSAYKDPSSGAFALVAINDAGTDVSLGVTFNAVLPTSVTPWVTSRHLDLAPQPNIPVTGHHFTATLPTTSVTTFVGHDS
jgi:glucuronoarabinoxylan endo-1,4-beta-xylanase